ncbi:MAG: carbamoyltransferase C-terminal domain-containing protein, partial [Candidatus Micrarchaeaceae archaeon]
DVAFAGGIFANVKANMMVRSLSTLKKWHIFPHMGDGGLALGAALYTNYLINGRTSYDFSPYLGPSYSEDETESMIVNDRSMKIEHESRHEQAAHAAELIANGEYLFWFQDRMEYGPRALGDRSILASAGSETVKDKLNMYVKKREWFQPFAPSMLEEEAEHLLEYDGKGYDKFMTSAYAVKKTMHDKAKSVMHVDGTARPHMVGDENGMYQLLLKEVKRHTGHGIVLNTSFNIHGIPLVMDPKDAIETMKITKTKHMFINGLFVTNRNGI